MINRRELLKTAASTGAVTALASRSVRSLANETEKLGIIDTNVSLFRWPFRRLPLDATDALAKKLESLGVTEAWAGSFEAVLHRDVAAVNQRLADECRRRRLLVPIGSINVELPDWEKELRARVEIHDMPGIRLHPNYHRYTLDDPRFLRLLQAATDADRFVQLE